jgi:hypothetical protein
MSRQSQYSNENKVFFAYLDNKSSAETIGSIFIPRPDTCTDEYADIAASHQRAVKFMSKTCKGNREITPRNLFGTTTGCFAQHIYQGACAIHSIMIAHHNIEPISVCTSFLLLEIDGKPTIVPVKVTREFVKNKMSRNWKIHLAVDIPHIKYQELWKSAQGCTDEIYSSQAKKYYSTCLECHRSSVFHQAFAPEPTCDALLLSKYFSEQKMTIDNVIDTYPVFDKSQASAAVKKIKAIIAGNEARIRAATAAMTVLNDCW